MQLLRLVALNLQDGIIQIGASREAAKECSPRRKP